MTARRKTRTIRIGKITIGSDAPISVQSMTNTPTEDTAATIAQIKELRSAGCDIIRVAVPTMSAAKAIAKIKPAVDMPVVADIHFNHKLALASIANGADGIRINPGNMRDMDVVREVVHAAGERGIPIRIGVNSGSIVERRGLDVLPSSADLASLMVDTVLGYCDFFESLGFREIKLSLKASDVPTTMAAYRRIAAACDYPLHVGITSAGTLEDAIVKSSVGIGGLLSEGIGDTIRVSITGPPVEEVKLGMKILKALELRPAGLRLVSCPTCGRCKLDLPSLVLKVREKLPEQVKEKDIEIAVMGCIVNGPGEAARADFGIAGGKGFGYLFEKGQRIKKVDENQLVDELVKHVMASL